MIIRQIPQRTATFLAAALLALAAGSAQAASGAATVNLVTGVAKAGERSLHRGDVVNAGETLTVGNNSYLSLSFADGGRVLLRPNTTFEIEAYEYPAATGTPTTTPAGDGVAPVEAAPAPGSGKAFFKLVRGGFRAISGLIGKKDHQEYLIRTTVATIGIRGTDYVGEICSGQECAGPYLEVDGDLSEALQVGVNEGSIEVTNAQGVFPVDQGQFGLASKDGKFFVLPLTPMSFLLNPLPAPESCQ